MLDIRVAIFEDNKLVRDAMQAILNGTPGYRFTGGAADGNRWEMDIRRSEPDVVLMDIEMPGLNGIELTKNICNSFPEVKVLIQTVFNDGERIFLALCAGASGYILKSDPPHRYLEAIKEVYNGGAPFNTTVAKKMLSFFSNKNVILVSPQSNDYRLSEREKELLQLIVEGYDYKTIATKSFISYETVRTHVKHIYKKLHVASRSEVVMKARQQGLL
ncbi:response regulator transcription factor [Agriterribacter humi]|jgi:DNA-binding NarL/FixJ family response regulator|uniref:response regulator transcription factor n=1 Tax=Agriterribacter humi TaxID=1104781 RepID=UPI001263EE5C|nr:response regulator transcription factor [Agriterribacter humi]